MFRDKETHLLNFGVFFYSTVLMLLSIVRPSLLHISEHFAI